LKLELPQIITQIDHDLHLCDEKSWQKDLRDVVTEPEKLLTLVNIAPKDYLQHFNARNYFPYVCPYHLLSV